MTEHLVKALILYSLPYPFVYLTKNQSEKQADAVEKTADPLPVGAASLLVADAHNTKVPVAVCEILYFSANPPYVTIHHAAKKYLHTATLKSLEVKLQAQGFIRIHKSFLVNLGGAVSYQSRLNGDYDLALTDGTVLRVSRNYAAAFKKAFDGYHRVDTK